MGVVAKHGINPKNFHYAGALMTAQNAALPAEVDGKNRLEAE